MASAKLISLYDLFYNFKFMQKRLLKIIIYAINNKQQKETLSGILFIVKMS